MNEPKKPRIDPTTITQEDLFQSTNDDPSFSCFTDEFLLRLYFGDQITDREKTNAVEILSWCLSCSPILWDRIEKLFIDEGGVKQFVNKVNNKFNSRIYVIIEDSEEDVS